jgi:hypothetical protein
LPTAGTLGSGLTVSFNDIRAITVGEYAVTVVASNGVLIAVTLQ